MTVSTVYRIMDSFCQVGLLSKFVDADGKTIYDITTQKHHHIHTFNGSFIDVEDTFSDVIQRRLEDEIPENEEIDEIIIQVKTKLKS